MTEKEFLIKFITYHYVKGTISRKKASEILGVSLRTIDRYKQDIKPNSEVDLKNFWHSMLDSYYWVQEDKAIF